MCTSVSQEDSSPGSEDKCRCKRETGKQRLGDVSGNIRGCWVGLSVGLRLYLIHGVGDLVTVGLAANTTNANPPSAKD